MIERELEEEVHNTPDLQSGRYHNDSPRIDSNQIIVAPFYVYFALWTL